MHVARAGQTHKQVMFFWDVLPCKMIVDRRFRGAYCLQKTILNIILAAVRT
jgi:hypothetical protein